MSDDGPSSSGPPQAPIDWKSEYQFIKGELAVRADRSLSRNVDEQDDHRQLHEIESALESANSVLEMTKPYGQCLEEAGIVSAATLQQMNGMNELGARVRRELNERDFDPFRRRGVRALDALTKEPQAIEYIATLMDFERSGGTRDTPAVATILDTGVAQDQPSQTATTTATTTTTTRTTGSTRDQSVQAGTTTDPAPSFKDQSVQTRVSLGADGLLPVGSRIIVPQESKYHVAYFADRPMGREIQIRDLFRLLRAAVRTDERRLQDAARQHDADVKALQDEKNLHTAESVTLRQENKTLTDQVSALQSQVSALNADLQNKEKSLKWHRMHYDQSLQRREALNTELQVAVKAQEADRAKRLATTDQMLVLRGKVQEYEDVSRLFGSLGPSELKNAIQKVIKTKDDNNYNIQGDLDELRLEFDEFKRQVARQREERLQAVEPPTALAKAALEMSLTYAMRTGIWERKERELKDTVVQLIQDLEEQTASHDEALALYRATERAAKSDRQRIKSLRGAQVHKTERLRSLGLDAANSSLVYKQAFFEQTSLTAAAIADQEALSAKLQEVTDARADLEVRVDELESELDLVGRELTDEIEAKEDELNQMQASANQLSTKLRNKFAAERASWQDRLDKAESKLEQGQQEINDAAAELREVQGKLDESTSTVRTVQRERDFAREQIRLGTEWLQSLQEDNGRLATTLSTARGDLSKVKSEKQQQEDKLKAESLNVTQLETQLEEERTTRREAQDRVTERDDQLQILTREKLQLEQHFPKLLEKILTYDEYEVAQSGGRAEIDAELAEVYLCGDEIYRIIQPVEFPDPPDGVWPDIRPAIHEFQCNSDYLRSPGETDERSITLWFVLGLYLATRSDSQDDQLALHNIVALHYAVSRELRGQGLKYGRQLRVKVLLAALAHRARRSSSTPFAICLDLIRSLLSTAAPDSLQGISTFVDAATGTQVNANVTEDRDLPAAGLLAQIAAVRLLAPIRADGQEFTPWISADLTKIVLASSNFLEALIDASKSGLVTDEVVVVRGKITDQRWLGRKDPEAEWCMYPDAQSGASICMWRKATPSGLVSLLLGNPLVEFYPGPPLERKMTWADYSFTLDEYMADAGKFAPAFDYESSDAGSAFDFSELERGSRELGDQLDDIIRREEERNSLNPRRAADR